MEPRWSSVTRGLAAGALICAALPPWGWWPLAPIGIALWLHALAVPARGRRFLVSWAVGVAWFGPSTLWMWGLTAPGYVLGVLLAWGPMVGVVGAVTPPDRRRLLIVPAAIVGFEWFHTHAPFGGVPLSMLAMTQAQAPLLRVAAVGGMLLLGLAVAALGVAVYVAVAERRWREPAAIVAGLAVLVGIGSYPWVQPVRDASGEPEVLSVAAVQGGGPQGTRYSSDQVPEVFQRHLDATSRIEPGDADLVLWPENAVNVSGRFEDHGWRDVIAAEAARLDTPIMIGVVEDADREDQFMNYVVTVQPDGTLTGRYDKERRVPFGEYVPLRFLFEPIAGGALPPRDQVPGVGTSRVEAADGQLAVVISWEVFFSRRVREGVRAGGEIVLNPTNGSSYWLTQVQSQQVSTSILRAVESGRWLLQVAPTGFSVVIDDSGRVLDRTGVSETRVIHADLPRLSGTTPAQALGDLPAVLIAVGLAAGVALASRRREITDFVLHPDRHEQLEVEPEVEPGELEPGHLTGSSGQDEA